MTYQSQASMVPALSPVDGTTSFGVWHLPGPTTRMLALSSNPGSSLIDAAIDGHVVLTLPKPWGHKKAVTTAEASIDGHQILIYAEVVNLGAAYRCDAFFDGYSLTTGEPIAVIDQRAASAWESARVFHGPTIRKPSRVSGAVWAVIIASMSHAAIHSQSLVSLALAIALVVPFGVVITFAGGSVYAWVGRHAWSPDRTRVADAFVVVAAAAATLLVCFVGMFVAIWL